MTRISLVARLVENQPGMWETWFDPRIVNIPILVEVRLFLATRHVGILVLQPESQSSPPGSGSAEL